MPNEEIKCVSDKDVNKALQGLRGFAIIMIALSHCGRLTDSHGLLFEYTGAAGVSLFLLLSGYLAALRHTECPITDRKAYFLGKVKKFYPLYLVTLLLALPFSWRGLLGMGSAAWKSWAKLLFNVLQIQTWVPVRSVYYSFNSVSWYLSLTLFWVWMTPWVVKLARRLTQGRRAMWCLCAVFAAMFAWCSLVRGTSVAHWLIYILPPVRLLDYFAGGVIYHLVQGRKGMTGGQWKYGAGMLLVLLAYVLLDRPGLAGIPEHYDYVCLWLAPNALLLTMAAESGKSGLVRALLENRLIVFLGDISFGLFLIHQLVICYTDHFWDRLHLPYPAAGEVLALVASVAAAYLWQRLEAAVRNRTTIGER